MAQQEMAGHSRIPHSLPPGLKHLDFDPFSTIFMDAPYGHFHEAREAGPVAVLPKYDCLVVARYAEVMSVLRDHETFISSRGVGLKDYAHDERFRPKSIILEADPPIHSKSRSALAKVLSPRVMRRLKEGFQREAELLVERVMESDTIDAISDIAERFPLTVFPDALGMPTKGRENLIPVGSALFDAFGPENELFERSRAMAVKGMAWLEEACKRESLTQDGFGRAMFDLVDAGDLDEREGEVLVRAMLMAGVDTTVNGIGAAIYALSQFPEEYARLSQDSGLARSAFEEAIRFVSPVQAFFRTASRPAEIAGVAIDEGTKVLMMLASANRDPRRWDEPDQYRIGRDVVGHVAFGSGIHMCVGQNLARLEGEMVLSALASRVAKIAPDGEPVLRYNNTLRGFSSLPIRIVKK